ncbi:unnamed protein product [Spirodela intermedia]|uniref:Uncharacterized protein n=1 Tax=Spirodela intermedia TaxID=51605 RepID=A0A7I8IUL5_SPIIN|nr:unnamed protein product [Spirodela intermedia]CAA6661665.1 unnamed protein product [Spirodela intermedia]
MSSLVERLRARTERRRLYAEDDSDDDDVFMEAGGRSGPVSAPEKYERIVRADARDELCHACGEGGKLINCETCTYAYHLKCTLPPMKVAPSGNWKCPECASPLNEIEKILDCEMRPTEVERSDASKPTSKQKFVKQYLVKWKGMSYLHCTWVSEKDFLKAFKEYPRLKTKVNNFKRQMDSLTNSEDEWIAIRPEWTTVDRIIASRRRGDEREYFVKWKELPYDECSWEFESDISAFQPQIDRYSLIQSKASKTFTRHKISTRTTKELKQKQKEFQQYEHSPTFLSGGSLHPYQLEGLNFLRYSWSKSTHVILADEMGLGKTIQSIAFLASLFEENISPHLVVAPLSTLRNWEREFATWAPQMNVVMYFGSSQARSVIREYEFFYPQDKFKKNKKMKSSKDLNEKRERQTKFDVLLTSYEMINMDSTSLKPINWECVIVDEGHRLKNKDSKLFSALKLFPSNHRVLLTGTPLQYEVLKFQCSLGREDGVLTLRRSFLFLNFHGCYTISSDVLSTFLHTNFLLNEQNISISYNRNLLSLSLHSLTILLFRLQGYYLLTSSFIFIIWFQNNLDELFILMHFLDAGKMVEYEMKGANLNTFSSLEDFQKEFKDINQEEQVARLHKMLAPHLLRRVKKDVMKDLPPKKELILRVELSSKQKEYYKAILTRNYQILTRRSGAQRYLLSRVLLHLDFSCAMELRQLCCMIEGVEPEVEPEDVNEGLRQLLEFSGKMLLLDKMMVKLKEQGHRVLIYSQFQHMLDLLEDYLNYKKWSYERIDGKINGAERQIRIDRFNAKNSTRFCFLLSTRAGGLGINLATADTVIIYDSDWNPHADLQAMARAHRLGQTNKVMIFRLITRDTIEERMMQLTKKKMILEHLVVGRLKAQTVNQEELDDIIRYGSKELFADENDEAGKARQIHYDDAAIERLLNRELLEGDGSAVDDEEDDDFLKAFKVANFEYIDEVEAAAAKEEEERRRSSLNKASDSNVERANYWDELLKDKYEMHQIDELSSLGKEKEAGNNSEDEDYKYEDDVSDVDADASGSSSARRAYLLKKKARLDNSDPLPLMEGEGKGFRVLGFNQGQRAAFVQILMSDNIWKSQGLALSLDLERLDFVLNGRDQYGMLFMSHIAEDMTESPTFSVRIASLQLIKDKVSLVSEKPGIPLFSQEILLRFPGLTGRVWKETHDLLLLRAILKHGYARWQAIVEDKELGLGDIVRQEQNLPSVNAGGSDNPMQGAAAGSLPDAAPDGTLEHSRGNQSLPDVAMLYQLRELQRRMVEFIRKRFLLLEKAIHTEEFLKENLGNAKPSGPAADDTEPEPGVPPDQSTCDAILNRWMGSLKPPSENTVDEHQKPQVIHQHHTQNCRCVGKTEPDEDAQRGNTVDSESHRVLGLSAVSGGGSSCGVLWSFPQEPSHFILSP